MGVTYGVTYWGHVRGSRTGVTYGVVAYVTPSAYFLGVPGSGARRIRPILTKMYFCWSKHMFVIQVGEGGHHG